MTWHRQERCSINTDTLYLLHQRRPAQTIFRQSDKAAMTEIRARETGEVLHTVNAHSLAGANLRGAGLMGADLRGADLSGANLNDADLSGADLREANLAKASLDGTFLPGADLRGACLRGASLLHVNLANADLRQADLRDSMWLTRVFVRGRLDGVDFRGADLRGARLSGWTAPMLLGYWTLCFAAIFAYYFASDALWPGFGSDHTFGNALGISLIVVVTSYLLHGLPYDLRHADLSGVVWDETTRWPWRFRPSMPSVPADGGASE